jgi:uncharacterized protein DUF6069
MTWYGSARPPQGRPDPTVPMPRSPADDDRPGRRRPAVNASRLWTGGVVVAVIAAGLAVVAVLVVRGILHLPILGVGLDGTVFRPTVYGYAFACAVAALAATAVMHLLLVATPRPGFYFGWIGGLCTAIATLVPLAVPQTWEVRSATAAANLVIGIAITVLVRGTAAVAGNGHAG